MSRPPINAEQTAAGITVDPLTLNRVIPESRRPDGTVRKQIKIRPGFTPQEDVRRFRGTRQAQMDANVLPKGHIIGWSPPPQPAASDAKPMSKAAKKNAKRREAKKEAKKEEVPENWDDDEASDAKAVEKEATPTQSTNESKSASSASINDASTSTQELTTKLEKLEVK
ncbi:hypothetical protein E4T56_gene16349 [Termitomyces sp. T112]|nr:hypothetical protein C0989_000063 [Termitomyces sp. Mn162]KAG5716538.1 hypothetical protein E4T56_gene16349 [Termitomyces sp. T112]KAH0587497.1 hypothetical protein H2248_006279 [Termitomyces sp. 'cryptogamus']KNZ79862.1 hypothetical protein J132_08520 [Termitomyces sp. J132]